MDCKKSFQRKAYGLTGFDTFFSQFYNGKDEQKVFTKILQFVNKIQQFVKTDFIYVCLYDVDSISV